MPRASGGKTRMLRGIVLITCIKHTKCKQAWINHCHRQWHYYWLRCQCPNSTEFVGTQAVRQVLLTVKQIMVESQHLAGSRSSAEC